MSLDHTVLCVLMVTMATRLMVWTAYNVLAQLLKTVIATVAMVTEIMLYVITVKKVTWEKGVKYATMVTMETQR